MFRTVFRTAPATVRTSRSLYFHERRHFTSAVGRREEEEERRSLRRSSVGREERVGEVRGDVTYDRRRERAREEEREARQVSADCREAGSKPAFNSFLTFLVN